MEKMVKIRKWLRDRNNREIIQFILTLLVFPIIVGVWALFVHFSSKTPSGINIEGGVTAGRDVTIQQIQITPDQTSKDLLRKMDELQAEIKRSSPEQRAILERNLAVIQKKFDNLQQAYEEQKAKLAEAYKALATNNFKREFSPEQVKQAKEALARGNTHVAEALFQQVLDKGVVERQRLPTSWGSWRRAASTT
jgi:hypothetical protein